MTPQIGVAAIITYKGKYLFSKRLTLHENGKYGVPGGKVDFGETLEKAVRREIFEEIGIKARYAFPLPVISNNVYNEENLHFLCVWFYVELDVEPNWDGKIDFIEKRADGSPKCEGWNWYTHEECLKLPLMRTTLDALWIFRTKGLVTLHVAETNDENFNILEDQKCQQ